MGVLLILDSDATPFTRSLGKKHHLKSKLKVSKFHSQGCAKDLICNKVSTRLVIRNFADYDCFPTFDFNFDCENPMQLCIFQLARRLHYGTKLLSCFSVIVWVFLSLTFFFHFHLRLFWRRKKWRIWCCFEESIAVEERDLVQVGLPTGSGTILADFFPIYIRRFFSENRLVEIYIV